MEPTTTLEQTKSVAVRDMEDQLLDDMFTAARELLIRTGIYNMSTGRIMKLTPEEAAAINCHMGFSDGNAGTVRDVSDAYEQYPLAWIIHVADEAATFLLER